jgi:hypothetical protein
MADHVNASVERRHGGPVRPVRGGQEPIARLVAIRLERGAVPILVDRASRRVASSPSCGGLAWQFWDEILDAAKLKDKMPRI